MPCRKCPHKANRLKAKLNATIERAKNWAKEAGRSDVVIYAYDADEDGETAYGYGGTIPASASIVELLHVDR